jgi:hypothetical protein
MKLGIISEAPPFVTNSTESRLTHTDVVTKTLRGDCKVRCKTFTGHAMNTYRGVAVQLHSCLTLTLDRGEWSTSYHGHFTPGTGTRYPFNRKLFGPQRSTAGVGGDTKEMRNPDFI